ALRAVAANRLREEAYREVIRLYLGAGQPDAALRQYRELERVLKAELDSEPGPETRALAALLESSGAEEWRSGSVGSMGSMGSVGSVGSVGSIGSTGQSDTAHTAHTAHTPHTSHTPHTVLPSLLPDDLEPVGGAVPVGSRFYVPRP